MKLISLTIENFKGIQRFDHRFDGRNATIYGANGTGKTTVQDAILWLLFGRDSQERCDFSIKPLDRNGNVTQPGIEVSVSATIEHGEKTVALRKVYREKWTKQRGSASEIFSGHESLCFVDDVPVSARGFTDAVAALVDEKVFRAITNVRWFAAQKWQDRRAMLFRMGGDVPASDLFTGDLEQLRDALRGRTVEDYRKVAQAAMRKFNGELSDIPVRIDEARRALDPAVEDEEDVAAHIAEITERLRTLDVPNRADDLSLQRANLTIEIGRLDAENRIHKQRQLDEAMRERNSRRSEIRFQLDEINHQLEGARRNVSYYAEEEQSADNEAERLREEWNKVEHEVWDGETVCPACGRDLPQDQIGKAVERWEDRQDVRLEQIADRGKSVVAKREEAQRKGAEAAARIPALQAEAQKLTDQLATIEREAAFVPAELAGYADRMRVLQERQQALDLEIAEASKTRDVSAQGRRMELQARLAALEGKRQGRKRNAETRARIAELERRHKEVAAAYEREAYLLQLCEEYTRRHMSLTEARINAMFGIVRWRLYEEQVNGGIADTCIPTVDGVPYGDLNNAARINAGIDIINTLSRFYGVSAPIFIDNAESVTHLLPMDAQVIRLVVSEHDPVLRVA
jgi:DNA repair exonuclease SbcCD ATPase subunit